MLNNGNRVIWGMNKKFQIKGIDLCTAQPLSYINEIIWRNVANPQSGELRDYSDQMYELLL